MQTSEVANKLYSILKERASKYDPIYYGDLYKIVGLNHKEDKEVFWHKLKYVKYPFFRQTVSLRSPG